MEQFQEQRQHRRHSVQYDCVFSSSQPQIGEGTVLDLSLGGARIMSSLHVPPKTSIELHIRPGHHTPLYVSRAVVRWVNRRVFGVEFQDLRKLEAATLTRLLWSLPLEKSK